ncbi:hypothetical protein [Commensalibacter intestini]|uniref:hypothetical protein n=1 Tax=Commensalibacter intestini TaxID=479936 RepID=UPI00058B890E|nr:hypothetical protein [Commensalibacter intestini]
MINLSEFSDEEWLNILPNYQRNLIQNLLSCGLDKQDIIQLWLNQENTSNTAGYGVKNNIGNFYKNFLKEINDLFCNDTKYSQERKHIQEYFSSTGKISFLAGISQYISNHDI